MKYMADNINTLENLANSDNRWAAFDIHPVRNSLLGVAVEMAGLATVIAGKEADVNIVEKVAALGGGGVIATAGAAIMFLTLEGRAFRGR